MRALPLALLGLGALLAALLVGHYVLQDEEDEPPELVIIDVEARRYTYEPGSDTPINVSLGSEILLRVRVPASDVQHGFAIEGYGIDIQVPPGEVVEVRFHADEAGTFRIYCTVFCGTGHPNHLGTLHVS